MLFVREKYERIIQRTQGVWKDVTAHEADIMLDSHEDTCSKCRYSLPCLSAAALAWIVLNSDRR